MCIPLRNAIFIWDFKSFCLYPFFHFQYICVRCKVKKKKKMPGLLVRPKSDWNDSFTQQGFNKPHKHQQVCFLECLTKSLKKCQITRGEIKEVQERRSGTTKEALSVSKNLKALAFLSYMRAEKASWTRIVNLKPKTKAQMSDKLWGFWVPACWACCCLASLNTDSVFQSQLFKLNLIKKNWWENK